jgi:putative tricarboxylic transport membrane protein
MSADEMKEVHPSVTLNKRVNQVFALLWVVIGIIVIISSRELKYFAEYGPGPGFVPFWLGVGYIVLGLVLLAQYIFSRAETEGLVLPGKRATWQMFLVMLGFFVFVYFAEMIGFLIGLGLLYLYLLVVVERKGWWFSLAVSVGNVFFFWVIFEFLLQTRLPIGFLDSFK